MSAGKNKNYKSIESGWIDVTASIENGMVHWPGDPDVKITHTMEIAKGDACNVSHISTPVHIGTHMDAPSHFTKSKTGIDKIPPSSFIGKARVIEIKDRESIRVAELKSHRIRKGERIIFKTRNSRRLWHNKPFDDKFVYISAEAAIFLAERNVRTIGVDYLSIGGMENGAPVHKAILKKGICIIEGLYLQNVEPGDYEMICLPMKIKDSDGSPCRALIRPLNRSSRVA